MKRFRFLGRRLFQAVISMWALATLTFVLLKIFPGSPYDEEISMHPSVQRQIENYYHLQQSSLQQYLQFMQHLVRGEFGSSQFFAGREAREVILQYFPTTATLSFFALTLAIVGALILALGSELSAWGRSVYQVVTNVFISLPLLLAGPLFIYLLGFHWDLLPVALLERPSSYILPVVVIAIKPMASLARLLQGSLHENAKQDYLRTARAFGFSPVAVLLKFNLRNALVPFVAYLGPLAALLLAGSTMVEVIFALPGLGSQFVEAVLNRDSAMVMGLTLFYGFFVFFFQMVVDLLLIILDPRLRSS